MGLSLKAQVAELTARVARLEQVIAKLSAAPQQQEELIWDDNGCEAGYYTLEDLQDKWAREDERVCCGRAESEVMGPHRRFDLVRASRWMTGGVQRQPRGESLREEFQYDSCTFGLGFLDAPEQSEQPKGSVCWSYNHGSEAVCFDF